MMQSAATAISALIGVFSWVARGGPVIGLGGSQYDDHRRSTSTQTQGHAQHLRHSGSIGSGVAGSGLERSGHEKLGGRSRLRGGGGGGGDGWNGVSDGSDGKVRSVQHRYAMELISLPSKYTMYIHYRPFHACTYHEVRLKILAKRACCACTSRLWSVP